MYAIIRTGGHQEKVTVGETISVDHLKQDEGSEINFTPMLISADDGEVVTDHQQLSSNAAVVGTVLKHVRGDKLEVFQYRQKTGYRRHIGHRQLMTLVEIKEIRLGDKKATIEEFRATQEAAAAEREAASKTRDEAREKARGDKVEKARAKKAAATKAAPAGAAKKKATPKKAGTAAKKAPPKKKAAKAEEAE